MLVSFVAYPPRVTLGTVEMDAVPAKDDYIHFHTETDGVIPLVVSRVDWDIDIQGNKLRADILVLPIGVDASDYIQKQVYFFIEKEKQESA